MDTCWWVFLPCLFFTPHVVLLQCGDLGFVLQVRGCCLLTPMRKSPKVVVWRLRCRLGSGLTLQLRAHSAGARLRQLDDVFGGETWLPEIELDATCALPRGLERREEQGYGLGCLGWW
ncbi:hypothetical protein EDB81DRAFT_813775 [Dactylonectria macrodidyma]|uniref:Secreted protein n=1 Tax=Dactylonectria macrodidyma TaxID=307937 RepID=A0A9P9DIM5_9HYPO|nr:hypothetical protein EDB81DRAFT_813775 [Dactylonectria macrodidyma]